LHDSASKLRLNVNDTMVLFVDLQAGIADLRLTVEFDRLRKWSTATPFPVTASS